MNISIEYIYVKSGSYWQRNKEFGKACDFVPEIKRSSAAIMLVLDCTSSLADTFDEFDEDVYDEDVYDVKSSAKTFIKTLYDTYSDGNTFTVNDVSFNMINVNGGTYMMGSTDGYSDDDEDSDERPVHYETIYSFKIGETEVTQGLWRAVMGDNPSWFTGDDNLPVENVSWDDCQTFINRLNELTGCQFRLPTEAEWEYAARGGELSNGYTYSGSDNINDVAWYGGNSGSRTHPVATKKPNELGIYDMSGNVWEWTSEKYSNNYSSSRSSSNRVLRGGCWDSFSAGCRVATRNCDFPGLRNGLNGLRVAL